MHVKRTLSLAVQLACIVVICHLIGRLLRLDAETQSSPDSDVRQAGPPIFDIRVKSLKIENADMAEALLKLRDADLNHVVFGFERIPYHEGEKGGPITLVLTDSTLGGAVRRLCEADSRYEYHVVSDRMVDVRPKGAAEDPNGLLNMRIKHYKIDVNADAAQVIERIAEDAPELREFLHRKAEEWGRETGKHPGTLGSNLSGNMLPTKFTLELHNATVRQILDAISLKSIEMFKEGKNYGPVGWQFDFVVHPNAPTGLGGFAKWARF
jgi:hypothetical protein